jgi:hypothetical protein
MAIVAGARCPPAANTPQAANYRECTCSPEADCNTVCANGHRGMANAAWTGELDLLEYSAAGTVCSLVEASASWVSLAMLTPTPWKEYTRGTTEERRLVAFHGD